MFSTPSYAKWEKVTEGVDGVTFYVDFGRMRKHDGFVYWWELHDLLKPSPQGDLSAKKYLQGDCQNFRFKGLSWSFHKEPMGRGTGEINNEPDKNWKYPPPDTADEVLLKTVCAFVK